MLSEITIKNKTKQKKQINKKRYSPQQNRHEVLDQAFSETPKTISWWFESNDRMNRCLDDPTGKTLHTAVAQHGSSC